MTRASLVSRTLQRPYSGYGCLTCQSICSADLECVSKPLRQPGGDLQARDLKDAIHFRLSESLLMASSQVDLVRIFFSRMSGKRGRACSQHVAAANWSYTKRCRCVV